MAGLMEALYRSFQNSRFKPVPPPLPIVSYAQGPGVRFGLPWPWEQVAEFEAPHETEPVLEARAPRTDGLADISVWRDLEPASLEPMINSAGRQVAQIYQGQLVESRKVLLHGARGLVVAVAEAGGTLVWRVVAETDRSLLHAQMRVPHAMAAGYRPHLDTMLGTWEWG